MKDSDKKRTGKNGQSERETTEAPKRDELDVRLRRYRFGRFVLLILLAVLAAGGLYALQVYNRRQVYEESVVSWEKEIAATERDHYTAYREFVLRYNRDGISYINRSGEVVWTISYEMSDPTVVVNGAYAAVIDRGGYQLYICNESGRSGMITTLTPIRNVAVSASGVTAIVVEDGLADRVYFYDLTGRKIDIEVMTLLNEDGHTLDMSLSPDGQQLVSAYVYLDQGMMKNQVVFRNFGEEGQEMIRRLVGGFRDYEDQLLARVVFLTDVYACAFAQDRICFYSLRNRTSPQMVNQVDFAGEVSSVFYSSDHVGVISANEGSSGHTVRVYDRSGEAVTQFTTDFAYTGANFSGGCVVLYNTSRCAIYNLHGELKFEANVGTGITWLSCLSERDILMIDGQTVRSVTLK